MSDEYNLPADKLSAITGLSDQQHRRLSKKGYFPPPFKGNYKFGLTLVGYIRYRREQEEPESLTKKRCELLEEQIVRLRKMNRGEKKPVTREALNAGYRECWEQLDRILQEDLVIQFPDDVQGLGLIDTRVRCRVLRYNMVAKFANHWRKANEQYPIPEGYPPPGMTDVEWVKSMIENPPIKPANKSARKSPKTVPQTR